MASGTAPVERESSHASRSVLYSCACTTSIARARTSSRSGRQIEGSSEWRSPHLDVVDAGRRGPAVDAEHRIARVAQVADGHRDARPGLGGAQQDRLLRAAAGASHRTQLEHAHRRPAPRVRHAVATRTLVRCVAVLTSDSARAVS